MKESDTTIDPALTIDNKNIYYPPGGILIWIIIMMESGSLCILVFERYEKDLKKGRDW